MLCRLFVELYRSLLAAHVHHGDVAACLEALERDPAGTRVHVHGLGKYFLAVHVEDGDAGRALHARDNREPVLDELEGDAVSDSLHDGDVHFLHVDGLGAIAHDDLDGLCQGVQHVSFFGSGLDVNDGVLVAANEARSRNAEVGGGGFVILSVGIEGVRNRSAEQGLFGSGSRCRGAASGQVLVRKLVGNLVSRCPQSLLNKGFAGSLSQ